MARLCVEDKAIPSSPGTYVLILFCPRAGRIQVGKLGIFNIRPGWYAYVGSAFGPGGLRARCRRHLRQSIRPHWHIDYLKTVALLHTIWFNHDAVPWEHPWAEIIGGLTDASIPIPRFGSSDCTCASHLFRFPGRPCLSRFRRAVRRRFVVHGPIMALMEKPSRQLRGNAL
jgi:Uri superfamily endonuclease